MGPGGFAASSSIASTPKARVALPPTSHLSGDLEAGQIPTISRSFTTAHDNLLDRGWGEAAGCRFQWTDEWTVLSASRELHSEAGQRMLACAQ